MTRQRQLPIIEASLSILGNKGNPSLNIARRTNDLNLIKILVDSALKDKPILVSLSYKNKLLFINSLIQNGILVYDPNTKEYDFTF